MKIIVLIEVVFAIGLQYHPSKSITGYEYNDQPGKLSLSIKPARIRK